MSLEDALMEHRASETSLIEWSRRHFARSALGSAAASLFLARGKALADASPHQSGAQPVTRLSLERHAIPGSDEELRMDLVTYQAGFAAPLHHHPVAGLLYVVSGTVESAYAGDHPRTFQAGQSLQDKATIPHVLFRNTSRQEQLRFLVFTKIKVGEPYVIYP